MHQGKYLWFLHASYVPGHALSIHEKIVGKNYDRRGTGTIT